MKLIDENYEAFSCMGDCTDELLNKNFWEYSVKEQDFFLKSQPIWTGANLPAYRVRIGKNTTILPESYYVTIGDYDGGIDFIKMEEVVGREFEVIVFNKTLDADSWILEPLTIEGYEDNIQVNIPYKNTKNPLPVALGNRYAILVSNVDLYSKMGSFSFADII